MKPATPPWLFGRPDGPINLRIQPRSLMVGGLLLLACLLAAMLALMVGTLPLTPGQVFEALFGHASGAANIIVNQWRLPRAVMALIFGAALGISGAIFQSLVRNPLGSPDIIGFNAGAYTGALVAITLFNGNYFEIASSALGGGLLSAIAVYLLAYRRGIQGFRLIIVGIAMGAMLTAFNTVDYHRFIRSGHHCRRMGSRFSQWFDVGKGPAISDVYCHRRRGGDVTEPPYAAAGNGR